MSQSKNYLYGIKEFPLYITNYIYPSLYIKYKNKLYSVCDIERCLIDYLTWNNFNPDNDNAIDFEDFEELSGYIHYNKKQVKNIIIKLIKNKTIKQQYDNVSRVV